MFDYENKINGFSHLFKTTMLTSAFGFRNKSSSIQNHRPEESITINRSGQESCLLEAYSNGRFHHLGSTNPYKTMHIVKQA